MSIPDDRSEGTPIFENTRQTHEPDTAGTEGTAPADVAKQQASRVADSAVDAGKDVMDVAKSEAANVAEEAKYQARDLLHQTQGELRDQAAHQQVRLSEGLRSVGDDLHQMASASDTQGVASDLVRQLARRSHTAASWLSSRDPEGVLRELKSYARRRPGMFIVGAIAAGVVVGRLTRALAAGPASSGRSLGSGWSGSGSGTSGDRGLYHTGAVTEGSAMTGAGTAGYGTAGSGTTGVGTAGPYSDATPADDVTPTGLETGSSRNPSESGLPPYDETAGGDLP
jgi:hypothetical protein